MDNGNIYIKLADEDVEFEKSASLLTYNEPWLSLKRTYDYSMGKVRDKSGELYVVYVENEIAGCILLEMHGNLKGFIRSFCIDENYRGSGVGAKVLRFAEKRIFQDSPNVFVFAASFNEGAKRFYEKNGYERIGVFKDYVQKGSDEILYRKTAGAQNDFKKENLRIAL